VCQLSGVFAVQGGVAVGQLADHLAAMTVDATSPDGHITAHIRGQADTLDITFRPGSYDRYDERRLADQVAKLAALLFVRYRRYEQEIVEAAFVDPLTDEGADFGPERGQYLDRIKQVVAEGASDDGQIRLSSRCLVSWEVHIAEGALDGWSEGEFTSALSTAAHRLLADYRGQVFRLKDEIYDLGYPESLRQWVGLGPRRSARRHG
jgi:hypothetical protein